MWLAVSLAEVAHAGPPTAPPATNTSAPPAATHASVRVVFDGACALGPDA